MASSDVDKIIAAIQTLNHEDLREVVRKSAIELCRRNGEGGE